MKPLKKPAYLLKNIGRTHPVWAQLLLFAGLFFLMAFAEAVVLLIIYTLFPASEGHVGAADLYAETGAILTVFLFARFLEKRSLGSLSLRLSKKTSFLGDYCMGLLSGAILFALAVLVLVLTDGARIDPSADTCLPETMLLFFFGYVIQGFSEELLCRGYCFGSLANSLSLPAAVLLSSLLFSALHLFNDGIGFLPFVNLTLFGVLTALLALRRGSLWGVSGLHTAWNFMQGNVFGIAVSGTKVGPSLFTASLSPEKMLLNGGSFGAEGGLAVTGVLCLGILFALLFMEQRDK